MIGKVPSCCDFCHIKLGPHDRYIKFRRPDDIHFMCLDCYRKNGGNPKRVGNSIKGSVDVELVPRKKYKTDIYNERMKTQNNVCAICGKLPSKTKRLCLDHDHETQQ